MSWKLTVGLEIHVELETKTKMFCDCQNDPFYSEPNTNVCPICYGLPGALPLLNKEAIALAIRFGQAINAKIPLETFWARKNYFYPDLPKGYQISQSSSPLIQGGIITIDGEQYHLDHAHLEEDAGKLTHSNDKTDSLADYNRAGVPLLEIVTRPDFHSAAAAKKFCQELQRIMRSLEISSADMEKGYMRCEANISVSQSDQLGTKIEVKNINSFRAVERAINYEFTRQAKALEARETLIQETRTWNDQTGATAPMRAKETSADYRYFPEPDLPMVSLAELAESDGDHLLPDAQRRELAKLGLTKEIIQPLIDFGKYQFIKEFHTFYPAETAAVSKLLIDLPELRDAPQETLYELAVLKKQNGWTKELTKQVWRETLSTHDLKAAAAKFCHVANLPEVVAAVINEQPANVASYKAGKEQVFNFLVGQVMAKTNGRADIRQIRQALLDELLK